MLPTLFNLNKRRLETWHITTETLAEIEVMVKNAHMDKEIKQNIPKQKRLHLSLDKDKE